MCRRVSGPHSYDTIQFAMAMTMVPNAARLRLVYGMAPSLDPSTTSLRAMLNGTVLAAFLLLVAYWAHAWMAWNARERLKLAEKFTAEE